MPHAKEAKTGILCSDRSLRDREDKEAMETRKVLGSSMLADNLDREIRSDYGDAVGVRPCDIALPKKLSPKPKV